MTTGAERGRGKTGANRFTLEGVLVVQRCRRERVMPDVRHAKHLERRRRVSDGVVALNAPGIEPRHVYPLAAKTVAEIHVFRQCLYVAKSKPAERSCDVLRDRFIALPGPAIAGRINDAARCRLAAPEDHGQSQARFQALDMLPKLDSISASSTDIQT